MTATHAVILNGTVIRQDTFNACCDEINKQCKLIKQRVRWADYCVATKRKKDPHYVMYRNKSRHRVVVMINLTMAPDLYLEELWKLYGWHETVKD